MALSSSANFFYGVIAALFAPLLMVLGFMIWDDHWTQKKGSAFSLNMFKCNITAVWFLLIIFVVNIKEEAEQSTLASVSSSDTVFSASAKNMWIQVNPYQNEAVKFLFASSTVGILIGDWTWIEGLKHLGARKVIVMDSLKPFLAELAGWVFFDEKFNNPVTASIGLMLTVVGVILVGLEAESEKEHNHENGTTIMDSESHNETSASNTSNDQDKVKAQSSYYGLFMAVSNVFLHTLGVSLTKKFGVEMTTWEINFVRFGFSGLCMLLLTALMFVRDRIWQVSLKSLQSLKSSDLQSTDLKLVSTTAKHHYDAIPTAVTRTQAASSNSTHQEAPWYMLPNLSRESWIRVTVGVVFVSFINPALTNYAMFQIPLALLLTLESIGPLYSLPLALLMHKECPSFRASIGAVFAVTGIALLSLHGKTN